MKLRHFRARFGRFAGRSPRSRWLVASGMALGGLLGAQTATAQTGGGAPAAPATPASAAATGSAGAVSPATTIGTTEPASQLEEVVVTARKKREKLAEVPLAITAITAQTIQDAGLRNLQDVANLTSGLTFSAAGAEAQLAPTIRGLTNLNGGSGDPNVAVFLDGIYLANNSAISLGLIAIERVEVVKGPVSALYGRNAFAGAINYISKKPPAVFGGEAELGFSSYGGKTAKATLGGPLVPGFASWLLSAGIDKSDGSWKDDVSGARTGGYDKRDGLLSVTLTPTPRLTLEGTAYYGDDSFDIVPLGNADNNCGSRTAATQVVNANAFRQFCGQFAFRPVEIPAIKSGAGAAGNEREVQSHRLRAGYDFDWMEASLLYGHNDVKQRRFNDFTGLRGGIPYALANAATPAVPNGRIFFANEQFGNVLNNDDDQLELRVQSKQDQALRWSLGYNYYDAFAEALTVVGIDVSGRPAGTVLANVLGSPIHALYGTEDGRAGPGVGRSTSTDRVRSPFGSLEWDILPALTASAELRHTREDKSQTVFSTTANQNPVNVAGNGSNTGTKSYSFNNYRTSLRYKLAPDSIVYASLANGTKAGGFNARATIADDLSFEPETNRTFEVGTKLAFLDSKLQVGFAVFHIETQGIQISGPAADPLNAGLVTKNFGSTRSNGFELDLAAVPIRGLRLNAGIGFADSKFGSDANDFTVSVADCANIPGCAARQVTIPSPSGPKRAVALDGLRVPRTSRWTGTLGAQYNGIVNDDWGWSARADYRVESPRLIQNANFASIPAKRVLNLRVSIDNDKYRLTLFVNNATDDDTPEGVAQNVRLNDFTGPYAGALPARRTYGLIGAVTF